MWAKRLESMEVVESVESVESVDVGEFLRQNPHAEVSGDEQACRWRAEVAHGKRGSGAHTQARATVNGVENSLNTRCGR